MRSSSSEPVAWSARAGLAIVFALGLAGCGGDRAIEAPPVGRPPAAPRATTGDTALGHTALGHAPIADSAAPDATATTPSAAMTNDRVTPEAIVPEGPSAAPGPARGVPTVRAEPPTVGPSYPPALISRVIRGARRSLVACSEKHAKDPPSSFTIVRFTIGKDGAVTDADFVKDDKPLRPDARQACILGVVGRLTFPAPGSAPITVRYPIAVDPQ